jgi:Mg2+ and Co2+ transporter CorA
MKVFTFLTVSFLPQTVIGSLFGMNMPVPMMDSQTLWPFFGITGITVFFTILAFGYFKHVKYI